MLGDLTAFVTFPTSLASGGQTQRTVRGDFDQTVLIEAGDAGVELDVVGPELFDIGARQIWRRCPL